MIIDKSEKKYIAIDLKSFYASVECVERGLDPLDTNLVVADTSRTEKTICLAVSPALKQYGISGRARLFEVVSKVKEINSLRRGNAYKKEFVGTSVSDKELKANKNLELSYIAAKPQMAHYMDISTKIYNIYLKYIAPEDICVYSIDEVFMDVTGYLRTYNMTAKELAMTMIKEVLNETGITATAGIGTNLYLCKIAMDIVAKHIEADKNGVRIAELDEMSYRKLLWNHKPITDFWRVGAGYSKRLKDYGMYTMGDIARCSIGKDTDFHNEELLYKLFGINAELLIDHAWGWEPCTMQDIRNYKPENNSFSSGQVLQHPYTFDKARIVIQEMADSQALDLVDKNMLTNQVVLTVGYDTSSFDNLKSDSPYAGEISIDRYGKKIPKNAHGSKNLSRYTSSSKLITDAVLDLFDRHVDPELLIRRMYVVVNHVITEDQHDNDSNNKFEQLDIFSLMNNEDKEKEDIELEKEKNIQKALLSVKKKYGKNSLLKGISFEEGATGRDRNSQIGGHKA